MKKWSDMANLPHEMRDKIDHHERNFNVSTVIFKKFRPIFLAVFKDPSLSPSKPAKNRKARLVIYTATQIRFSQSMMLYQSKRLRLSENKHLPEVVLLLSCVTYSFETVR